jgi:pimeloyl-ACP methyl ester carboxylesterase
LIYLLAAASLYVFQRKLLYFPTPPIAHGLQVEWLQQGDQRLEIQVLNPGQPNAVLYFGGNAEMVSDNAELFSMVFADTSVYLLSYRGYGASGGEPSESALFEDAIALYDHVTVRHKNISLIGRSLGSGVAIYLASHRLVKRMALVTPYDSIASVAQTHYPYFPVRLLIKDPFDSISRASDLSAQVLVILAESDEVIPRAHSEVLIAALDDVQLWIAEAAGHNSVGSHAEYGVQLQRFLQGE